MSQNLANAAQWIVVLAFFLAVVGALFAEAAWLKRKGRASFGKAFAFSALSNITGLGVGLFVGFVVILIFIMFAFENPLKNSPYENSLMTGMAILGIIGAPLWLLICKRILLALMKIQTGSAAWLYALASSLLILVVSLGGPVLIGYVMYKIF